MQVFVIVTATLFLPVLLETYARDNGKLAPDYTVSCPASEEAAHFRCAVKVAGHFVDTASFSLFTYSASVFVQALTVISMGGLADDPHTRHRLLTTFATIGSLLTISFILLPSDSVLWPLCIPIALVANVTFGASIVCLNAHLPDLGRTTPEVLLLHDALHTARSHLKATRASTGGRDGTGGDSLLSASQALVRATDDYNHAKGLATSRISSRAVAMGYAAGISGLVLLLVPIKLMGPSTWSLRCAIAGSGVCWGLGTIPASIWLRPPPHADVFAQSSHKPSFGASLAEGWRGLVRMLREWRRLPSTFTFLAAWFLLSDAFSTLTSTAILFAKTTLSLPTSSLILIAALTPSAGIGGAILFPKLQHSTLPWSSLQMLLLLVVMASLVPLWGLAALREPWQIYLLAVVFGAIYGSFQAYARTCFAELVPSSQSARWFGLYSITDKSSSFLGPLLVAVVTNFTGQIRHGFWLILFMLLLALPILSQVDMHQGRADAEAYERELLLESSRATDWDDGGEESSEREE
ncbi:autophagy-related protein 22-like protein [Leucosporidium creatinivorum]|uniref:Autophagy-related protein n=1 Tax=Leucosporidium creatinivorum TaxID=106004 RepID=A0A1Y2FKI3_9BASI|nr:autophagy-related protein 22-like protein [Leucosporidium creatinivorum]